MALVVFNPRHPLSQLKQALDKQEVTFGFLGGSITEARVTHNWPDFFIAQFANQFKDIKLHIENAALGATGSEFGLMRVQEDIINKKVDCVFIEYAVNDWWTPSEDRIAAMEGIVRKLKDANIHDIIFVYTFSREMISYLDKKILPPTVTDFETLASHYQISSVFVGLDAYHRFNQGEFRFEAWLPDGLHPQDFGSKIYADGVFQLIKDLLMSTSTSDYVFPNAYQSYHWQRLSLLPLHDLNFTHPFVLKRHALQVFAPYMLSCHVPGETLIINFTGTGLLLTFDFGRHSGEIMYRVNQGNWITSKRDRPNWVGNSGWLRTMKIVDKLNQGNHQVEIKTLSAQDANCWWSNFDIVYVAQIV
jgi:lysophospholipase L1-like esterase